MDMRACKMLTGTLRRTNKNTLTHAPGFDLENGRLDVSVHPFTGGAHPTDVRMTTRFKADDLTEGLTGACE